MKKIIYILCLIFLFGSCTTQRKIFKEQKENTTIVNNSDSLLKVKEWNLILQNYKDSLIYIKGLMENSSNSFIINGKERDSSHLETTYSISDVTISPNGEIVHSLRNKDSIPTRIIYKEKIVYKEKETENVVSNSNDTIINISEKEKEEVIINETSINTKQKFKNIKKYIYSYIFGFISCIIVIIILWILIKKNTIFNSLFNKCLKIFNKF